MLLGCYKEVDSHTVVTLPGGIYAGTFQRGNGNIKASDQCVKRGYEVETVPTKNDAVSPVPIRKLLKQKEKTIQAQAGELTFLLRQISYRQAVW